MAQTTTASQILSPPSLPIIHDVLSWLFSSSNTLSLFLPQRLCMPCSLSLDHPMLTSLSSFSLQFSGHLSQEVMLPLGSFYYPVISLCFLLSTVISSNNFIHLFGHILSDSITRTSAPQGQGQRLFCSLLRAGKYRGIRPRIPGRAAPTLLHSVFSFLSRVG